MIAPAWQSAVDALKTEVAELRAQLATEVRTRRLVVVDDAGNERIYTEVNEGYASLEVTWGSRNAADFEHEEEHMSAYLVAGGSLGVCLSSRGNVIGEMVRGGDDRAYISLEKDSTTDSEYLELDVNNGLVLRHRPSNAAMAQAVMQAIMPMRNRTLADSDQP